MFSRRLPHRFVIVYFSLSVMLKKIYRVHCTALFADSANVLTFLLSCQCCRRVEAIGCLQQDTSSVISIVP